MKEATHTHVHGDRDEHRLTGQDDEGSAYYGFDPLANRHLLPLEGRPVSTIARLLTYLLCAPDKEDGSVCLRNGEENDGNAGTSKHRQEPEHPTPGDASDGHEPADSRADGRACERCKSEHCHSLPAGIRVPDIGDDGSVNGLDPVRSRPHTFTYPLFAKGAAAKMPLSRRKIRIEAVFGDRAQPTWKPV